jgi:hypothetical protein
MVRLPEQLRSREAMLHFGLGGLTECDVEVTLPFQKGVIRREHVKANQRLTVGCLKEIHDEKSLL